MPAGGQAVVPMSHDPPAQRSYHDGVGACMSWSTAQTGCGKGKTKKGAPQTEQTYDSYLPRKPGIGESRSRAREIPTPCYLPKPNEEGTVIQALRGWPAIPKEGERDDSFYRVQFEEMSNGMDTMNIKDDAKSRDKRYDDDPHMGDLIGHRFMNQEKACHKKSAGRKRAPLPNKSNRTAQLRQIHNGNLIQVEKELWQMPKFKDNAKPTLDTGAAARKNQPTTTSSNYKYQPDMMAKWEQEREALERDESRSSSAARNAARSPYDAPDMDHGDARNHRPTAPINVENHDTGNCQVRYEGLPNDIHSDPMGQKFDIYDDFDP